MNKKKSGKLGSDARWKNRFSMLAELSRLLSPADQVKFNIKGIREKHLMAFIKALRKVQGLKD